MSGERQLSCVVSGSFDKFKPEIDTTIVEFRELGVKVRAPDTGWLFVPPEKKLQVIQQGWRPLPSEVGKSLGEIEDAFLAELAQSDFHYVENPQGYIGIATAFEIGSAATRRIPTYARYRCSSLLDFDGPGQSFIENIKILPPSGVIADMLS